LYKEANIPSLSVPPEAKRLFFDLHVVLTATYVFCVVAIALSLRRRARQTPSESQLRQALHLREKYDANRVMSGLFVFGFVVLLLNALLLGYSIVLLLDRDQLGIAPNFWKHSSILLTGNRWVIDVPLTGLHYLVIAYRHTLNLLGLFGVFFYVAITLAFLRLMRRTFPAFPFIRSRPQKTSALFK